MRRVFVTPGNPGIRRVADILPAPSDIPAYSALAEANRIDLTVVGPEAPLVAGIVDEFRARGLTIIGPTKAAAELEASKIFTKRLSERAGIPTARTASSVAQLGFPIVIKADGLAAGKGVIIAQNEREARDATTRLGPKLLIEEFLDGEEVSFIALCNGTSVTAMLPSQDHKRVHDGDSGPNTGGMGAYCDSRILTSAQTEQILERIVHPALHAMAAQGHPFTGFLYAGLMMTADGPKLLEFNVRLGDPEAQALMHSFDGDLGAFLMGDSSAARWSDPAVSVVMAAQGYPEQPITGDPIHGIAEAENTGAVVFQAGTKQGTGEILTAGGRVLSVTAGASTLPAAIDRAYEAIEKISFRGMHYRRDIGRKGLIRW